ncbi:MAG: acetylglutamate kinase [Opitutales bacterium]
MIDLSQLDVTTKSAVLLEALPYVQRFRDAIFVVKYGGAFMDDADPAVRTRVATDIAFLAAVGIKVVVVHGGGKAITRALTEAMVDTRFEHGLRVTDQASVKIVEHTLNKVVNLEICEILQAKNARPLGLLGNSLLVCDKKQIEVDGKLVDVGYVGETHTVKTKIIKKALNDGYIPVISPIAIDENGQVYNTNADAAAGRVAAALRARRLIYLCDVPGLMRDINDPASLISTLQVDEVDELVKNGVISKGMIPKTDSAVDALKNGVHRVHFIDGEEPHSLLLEIFTDKGVGTEIVNA